MNNNEIIFQSEERDSAALESADEAGLFIFIGKRFDNSI